MADTFVDDPQIASKTARSQHIDGPSGRHSNDPCGRPVPLPILRASSPGAAVAVSPPGVETKNVTSPSLTVAHDHFFGLKVIGLNVLNAPYRQHFLFDLGHGTHACRQKISATGLGQFLPILRRVHARISHKHRPPQFQSRRSARTLATVVTSAVLPGQNPAPHRHAVPGDSQCDHHLGLQAPLGGQTGADPGHRPLRQWQNPPWWCHRRSDRPPG